MTDAVAAQLLEALRERLGRSDLDYVEEPHRLTGGYYTDNRAFRRTATDPTWSAPLVLRLFPREGPFDLVRREAFVQNALADQGFPAPEVLWWSDDLEVLGNRFLIMKLLPGRTPMGGAEFTAVVRSAPWMLRSLPKALAEVQAALHHLDPAAYVEALGDLPAGVDRWLDLLDQNIEGSAPDLALGVRWLRDHRPPEPRRVICHGDLWPGNLLRNRGQLSGVLDWSLATVADPAFDVGFTAMSLTIAPIDVGPRLEGILTRQSAWLGRRFVRAYVALTGADLSAQPYYEALRCVLELVLVIEHRRALANGVDRDTPAPTWDVASDRMIDYFEARTGVPLELPPRVISS